LVGERGPEIIAPGSGFQVIPTHALRDIAGFAGGTTS
jgi:hypothetical protein